MTQLDRVAAKRLSEFDQRQAQVREWFVRCMTETPLHIELYRFSESLIGRAPQMPGDYELMKILASMQLGVLSSEYIESLQEKDEP